MLQTLPVVQKKKLYLYGGAVLIVLLAAFLLRLVQLEHYPLAVNQDELSNIYDGYSIAETGADRWGVKHPVILRGFGKSDYLTVKLFGFSVFSGRLVSAVLGCLSLLLLYRVAQKMGGRLYASITLLLAALSPWHLQFSRTASEGAMLPPFFLISACYLWQRAKEAGYSLRSMALLGLCFGLATNTYQASKLLFFLFALLVFGDLWQQAGRFWASATTFALGCVVGAVPQLVAAVTMPEQFFARASGSMMPFSFSFGYLYELQKHIVSNLSPDFLFFSFGAYNNLTVARLLPVEVLFFYLGLFFLYRVISKNQIIRPAYFYTLLLFVILPSALTTDNPHALRASSLSLLCPLLTAAGILVVYRYIERPQRRNIFLAAAVAAILVNSFLFLQTYTDSVNLRNQAMQGELTASSKMLTARQRNYDKVFIENSGNQNYIYTIAFGGMTPEEFQKADKQYDQDVWDNFHKAGNYYFLNQGEIADKLKDEHGKVLLLLTGRSNAYNALDSIEVDNQRRYLYENRPPHTW